VSTADTIRNAFAQVATLRARAAADARLGRYVQHVKVFQASRFSGTYADVLQHPEHDYAKAAQFFLTKLYSPADHSDRDAQFAKIAGAIEKLFPAKVGTLAVRLAQLHALTEELDLTLAGAWASSATDKNLAMPIEAGLVIHKSMVKGYVQAWRHMGRHDDRQRQLATVLDIGRELGNLTRMPGLRHLLRMMRGPARSANLASLQLFLEQGFDTFSALSQTQGGVRGFLELIAVREAALLNQLFDADLVASVTQLRVTLGLPP
jgi:hypothetical protein